MEGEHHSIPKEAPVINWMAGMGMVIGTWVLRKAESVQTFRRDLNGGIIP